MSALPKAVQAQLDAAEALQAQLAEPAPQEGNTEAVESLEPAVEAQPVETVQQQTQVASPPADDAWEQRFKVIEGKYRAEIPRLHEQNRELVERLEQALQALETKNQPKAEDVKLVTDADVEAFGSDLVDMVRRASREEFDGLSKKLVDELDRRFGAVAEKVSRTEKVVAQSAEDKFWESVLREHNDFEAVNNDPRWFAFLDERITGSRLTRRASANDAIAAKDAMALNELLAAFKQAVGVPPAKPAKQKPNLNAQVAPNTSSASAPSADPAGQIWSERDYADALDHRNIVRIGREAYEQRVAEAEQALAEGRVRFG